MKHLPVKRFAFAIGSLFSLAAVTAFGVAPLTSTELPPRVTMREVMKLEPEVLEFDQAFVRSENIRRGETLASLLSRLGSSDEALAAFVRSDPLARKLLQFQSGRTVQTTQGPDGEISSLVYRLEHAQSNRSKRLVIRRDDQGAFRSLLEDVPLQRHIEMRSAEITSSLFAATDAAGIPEAIGSKIADIFQTDIDFHKDLRKGDRLRVVYEMLSEPDSLDPAVPGRILAIEFLNGSRRLEAVWYADGSGSEGDYYTFDGKSLKQTFLRSPLEFSRISSGYSENRHHPVLRDWRAHRGVDYAAPAGTKVRTVASGTIEFAGQQRGYGNVVIVRHDPKHSTLYAHLRGFAPGLDTGTKVEQGDVIGFVGQTGWATGPHLHFEFHVAGRQVDPLALAMPKLQPLEGAALARFRAVSGQYQHQLALLDSIQLARFE